MLVLAYIQASCSDAAQESTIQMTARGEERRNKPIRLPEVALESTKLGCCFFLVTEKSDMFQITKARHIPSGRVKTGTIQKHKLSLAVSQAEGSPECQEQARKKGGAEQQKRTFLKGQQRVPEVFP